jgi:hypothetical protein
MIETVTMYRCSETGKLFKTSRGAKNSSERARKKKLADSIDRDLLAAQRDYVRLNATSPQEIIELVKSKAEEFWGLRVESFQHSKTSVMYSDRLKGFIVHFGNCSIQVDGSKSSRLDYINSQGWRPSIGDLLFNGYGFKGLETGSGCPGRCNDYKFDMDLRARLDQFPIIEAHHRDWVKHKEEYDWYQNSMRNAAHFGKILAVSTPEFKSLGDLKRYYLGCADSIRDSMEEVENHHVGEFLEKWKTVNPEIERDLDLWNKFG